MSKRLTSRAKLRDPNFSAFSDQCFCEGRLLMPAQRKLDDGALHVQAFCQALKKPRSKPDHPELSSVDPFLRFPSTG
eukprot:11478186-Karenia_brevis.AAC.1